MTQEQRIDPLTSTRFFAALSVVLYHGGRDLGVLNHLRMFTAGDTAVGYFFVLSGFIISLAYYRPTNRFDFRNYLLARFSRIYPVYILSFALTCLFYIEILSKIKPDKVLANIFLYQAWFPDYAFSFNIAAWSLSVEVFFYLVFPILVMIFKRWSIKTVLWISFVFWAASQIVHAILFAQYMPEETIWLFTFPLFHLNSFLLGVTGGIWYLTRSPTQDGNRNINRAILLISLGFVFLALTLREYASFFPGSFSLDAGLLAPAFLLIILTIALDRTDLSKRLSHPWLVLLGDASYALFILHLPLLWLFRRLLDAVGSPLSYDTMFSIHVISSIIISILVFKYVECPARDWLRKNARTLLYIFLDVILILVTIQLCFSLRLGSDTAHYPLTQTLVSRVGVAIFFLFLLVYRFYIRNSALSLALATLTGAAVLSGFMYLAWIAGWVEIFPRSIILLIPFFVYASIHLSRFGIRFLMNKFPQSPKLNS